MPFKASSAWEHSKKLTVFPADLEPYYGDILGQYESAYNTAEEAKSRGLDPNEIVESKTVFDLADRVQGFDDLMNWVHNGVKPEGDDFLASDLTGLGRRWTHKVLPGDSEGY